MHGIVEPEAVVVRLAELRVVRVRSLGALRSRNHLQRARKRKSARTERCDHHCSPDQSGPLRLTAWHPRSSPRAEITGCECTPRPAPGAPLRAATAPAQYPL